ncbi:sex hormone-binding globulin-like, partial [Mustelus asterias]
MFCFSLLTLLAVHVAAIGDLNLYQRRGFMQSEQIHNHCFYWSNNKNPNLLSLAQHWLEPIPSEVLTVQLERVLSFESEFDLRTYDPEGVVFYGDANAGSKWFLLALRDGRPEIQIANEHCHLVVSSSDILSDGKWKKIEVKSHANEITLTVDQKVSLAIAIFPSVGLDTDMIDMRIAMGGLLINESSLLRPLKHPLDACITNWNWLHQNTSWIMDKVAQNPNLQCPDKIMPGSFFSGTGMAVFRCSDIHNDTDPQSWSLSFSVLIRPRKHSGQVMALLTGDHDPLVKLHFTQQDRHENFKLILGATTLIDIRGPSRLCNGQILNITITESEATLQIGDQSGHQSVDATAFAALKTSWFKKDTLLFLGSLPGKNTKRGRIIG